jgi:hypothetical protein
MGNVDLPQQNEVKYLGMHLDRKLVMGKAHENQKKTPQGKSKQMHWLLGRRSTLSIESKLLYKAVLEPI